MAAVITDERIFGRKPNKGLTGADNPSNTSLNDADEPMTKADREEIAELRERVHQQQMTLKLIDARSQPQPQIQVQAQAAPNKWLMVALTAVMLLSGAGSFVGASGIWVGKKDFQAEHTTEQMKEEREAREKLQGRFDHLRDLYMVKFGEDPEKVDVNTMKRNRKP